MERAIAVLSVLLAVFLLNSAAYANFTNETDYSLGEATVKSSLVKKHESAAIRGGGGGGGAGAAGIMVTVSESGLNYAKEVLVNEILAEMTPLLLPDVKAHVTSPIGRVDTQISQIVVSDANVSDSDVELGKTGVTVVASDVNARVRFQWEYQYTAPYLPFPVNDSGWADVKVNGMQVGMTFTLLTHNGTVRLTVVECGTYIDNLEIELEGGASWLYQLFVHAFDDDIRAMMESAISKRIVASAKELDKYLLGLPRFLPVDDVSAIDMTVVQDPWVSPLFLSVGVRGEFSSLGKPPSNNALLNNGLPPGMFCGDSTKMVTIALSDDVVNSAAAVYYEAGFLEWLVDEVPQEAWLNTHFWRWLIPQLYKKYPNMAMALDFACSAAPSVQVQADGVMANAAADMTLLVKSDDGHSEPVACISLALSMDAIVNVVGNNITAGITLDELKLELKWSNVGKFRVNLLQPTIRTVISRVILPILNKKLEKGFPLPTLPVVDLKDADIQYDEGFIFICSNVYYKGEI